MSTARRGIYYHVTVRNNLASILEKGLLINERLKNAFGLDSGVDYGKVYEDEKEIIRKPPCIHLTTSMSQIEEYKAALNEAYPGKSLVVLQIKLNLTTHKTIPDPEGEEPSCYCVRNIPAIWIREYKKENKLKQMKSAKSQHPSSATSSSTAMLDQMLRAELELPREHFPVENKSSTFLPPLNSLPMPNFAPLSALPELPDLYSAPAQVVPSQQQSDSFSVPSMPPSNLDLSSSDSGAQEAFDVFSTPIIPFPEDFNFGPVDESYSQSLTTLLPISDFPTLDELPAPQIGTAVTTDTLDEVRYSP